MRTAIILCLVFAVGLDAETVHLSGAQRERAEATIIQCMKETGVKPELIAEAKKGHIGQDESFKKFMFCFFQKAGIIDHDGKLNIETALSKLPPGADKTEFKKVLEGCKTKKGKDAVDTVYELFKCYQAGSKTQIFM